MVCPGSDLPCVGTPACSHSADSPHWPLRGPRLLNNGCMVCPGEDRCGERRRQVPEVGLATGQGILESWTPGCGLEGGHGLLVVGRIPWPYRILTPGWAKVGFSTAWGLGQGPVARCEDDPSSPVWALTQPLGSSLAQSDHPLFEPISPSHPMTCKRLGFST